MLTQICFVPRFLIKCIAENLNHEVEDFLADSLTHVVRKVLVQHQQKKASDAHELTHWVVLAHFILVHDRLRHSLNCVPELLLIVYYCPVLLEIVPNSRHIDGKWAILFC